MQQGGVLFSFVGEDLGAHPAVGSIQNPTEISDASRRHKGPPSQIQLQAQGLSSYKLFGAGSFVLFFFFFN